METRISKIAVRADDPKTEEVQLPKPEEKKPEHGDIYIQVERTYDFTPENELGFSRFLKKPNLKNKKKNEEALVIAPPPSIKNGDEDDTEIYPYGNLPTTPPNNLQDEFNYNQTGIH